MTRPLTDRSQLPAAHRIVVKVGSSSLTAPDGTLEEAQVEQIARALGTRVAGGREAVLVSSGAVAAGIRPLGLAGRPTRDLSVAQAAASVGQGILVSRYAAQFARHGVTVGQVLLTAADMERRQHYVNARRALQRLLRHGVLPVVNENDTVATREIRFGDNDRLAALVAQLVDADALVLLTDVDGLYDGPPSRAGTRLIRTVSSLEDLEGVEVTGRGSAVGTGGMLTKLDAALAATGSGIPVLLASAVDIEAALAGRDVGTWFAATGARRAARTLWLAHAAEVRGVVTLDDGAVRAVVHDGRSLLAAGVIGVEGEFDVGDVVELRDAAGAAVARGRTNYEAGDVARMAGRRSSELSEFTEPDGRAPQPVVHRDDLALVRRRPGS